MPHRSASSAPLLSPDEALARVLAEARPLPPCEVEASAAGGLVLAETITADRDYPPFDRSMMDGCAVRLADAGQTRPVAGIIAAGQLWPGELPAGAVLEIMTGAPCPPGCEAVVPREDVLVAEQHPQTGAPVRVTLPVILRPAMNMQPRGAEAAAGSIVLEPGQRLVPVALAVLASVGCGRVRVHPAPRVALLITGDELRAGGPAAIRDSNGPMLRAMCAALGIADVPIHHASDDEAALRAQAGALLAEADVLITSGGVSAGRFDFMPGVLAALGLRQVFHKVAQKPGKPLLFAVREREGEQATHPAPQLAFGLPGNPLSCQIGFHRYIAPALRALMAQAPESRRGRGVLKADLAVKGARTVFQLARVAWHADGWRVTPQLGKGSADIFRAAAAQVMLRLEPGTTYAAGTAITFEWLDGV